MLHQACAKNESVNVTGDTAIIIKTIAVDKLKFTQNSFKFI